MMSLACLAAIFITCALASSSCEDAGFLDWFTTEKVEVWSRKLAVNGSIPSYVSGIFAQSGPAQFEMGGVHFGHALDGFAKKIVFEISESQVVFSTSFLQSGFYTESVKENKIAPGMTAAETHPPTRKRLGLLNAALGKNDNNYIKPQKIGEAEAMTSDTMYVTLMNSTYSNITKTISALAMPFSHEEAWHDHLQPAGYLCIQANFAHGAKGADGSYIVAAGCQTANVGLTHRYILFKVHDSNIQKRELVTEVHIPNHRRPSYMHQNAVTENHYIIIGTPLYMDLTAVMEGTGLAQGGLDNKIGDDTAFHVISRSDGSYRNAFTPGFLMGHVINSWEEGNDVLIDITVYAQKTGGFFARFLLDVIENKTARDTFDKASVKRFRIKPDGSVEAAFVSEPNIDIELPTINPAYEGKKYCFVWAVQFGTGTRSFASIGVIKLNVCTGEAITTYEDSIYPSEHRFIPRPGAAAEDDGVLVGLAFNGTSKLSTLQVLDAKTLARQATVPTGIKIPFPIHTTWFGDRLKSIQSILV